MTVIQFLRKKCPKCKGRLKVTKIINVSEPNDEFHKQLDENDDFFPHDDAYARCVICKQRWHVTIVDNRFRSMSPGFSRWFDLKMYLVVFGPFIILAVFIIAMILGVLK